MCGVLMKVFHPTIAGLSHIATLQQFEALLSIPGIDPKMVTVSFNVVVRQCVS
jgi:hypothetical protein